LLRVCLRSC